MVGSSGSANCYVRIDNCITYDNEHCTECNDSYSLSTDKKSCQFICSIG